MARLGYPEESSFTGEGREFYERLKKARGGPTGRLANVFASMTHAPRGAFVVGEVGRYLRESNLLDAASRETAILAVASDTRSFYEWSAHIRDALRGGVDPEAIGSLAEGKVDSIADPRIQTVARYAMELSTTGGASDESFEALKKYFNKESIVELTITVGYYSMLARILNGLGVQLDDPNRLVPFGRPPADLV